MISFSAWHLEYFCDTVLVIQDGGGFLLLLKCDAEFLVSLNVAGYYSSQRKIAKLMPYSSLIVKVKA